jgi:ferric-dicitrate binding protein FerR (iron transport regulator)
MESPKPQEKPSWFAEQPPPHEPALRAYLHRKSYLSDSTPDRAASVRGRLTEFSGTPLIEAVDSFNRQNEIKLSLGDPSLAGLRISGDFPSDDPDGFARVLESSLGIQAVHRSSREIVLQPSP